MQIIANEWHTEIDKDQLREIITKHELPIGESFIQESSIEELTKEVQLLFISKQRYRIKC